MLADRSAIDSLEKREPAWDSSMPIVGMPDNHLLDVHVIRNPEQFRALKPEWDALWAKADGRHQQAFSVCWLSWIHVAGERGRALSCITVRRNGVLVLVWPLVNYRQLVWTWLRPLTPDTAEHSDVLTERGPSGAAMIDLAWRTAMRDARADVLLLPYAGANTRLYSLASAQPGLMSRVEGTTATARLRGEHDWPSFCAQLGNLAKKKPGARERRLAKEGALVIRMLEPHDSAEFTMWVDWLLARKRGWADRGHKQAGWLASEGYRAYLVALLGSNDPDAMGKVCVITLDGEPVAASIIGLGRTCVNGLITGFDVRRAKFGLGLIVVEHCVRWALEHDRDFDFGVGSERFKGYWSRDQFTPTWSFEIATTYWGRVAVPVRHAWHRLQHLMHRKAHDEIETTTAAGDA